MTGKTDYLGNFHIRGREKIDTSIIAFLHW